MKPLYVLTPAVLLISVLLLGQAAAYQSPFACNRSALTSSDRKRHFDELGPQLRGMIQNVREVRDGYEFQFPSDPASFRLVAEWAAAEHLCCAFFDIELRQERESGGFWMRLSGRPGVKQFIETDLAKWMHKPSPVLR
jgi:hypothetical protein